MVENCPEDELTTPAEDADYANGEAGRKEYGKEIEETDDRLSDDSWEDTPEGMAHYGREYNPMLDKWV